MPENPWPRYPGESNEHALQRAAFACGVAAERERWEARVDREIVVLREELELALLANSAPAEEAVLRWTCETCGWTCILPMPGYAGDGHYHYGSGNRPCGPLVARREGFIRARPGELLDGPSHPVAGAAVVTDPAGLNTDRPESAALSSPAEPDTEDTDE